MVPISLTWPSNSTSCLPPQLQTFVNLWVCTSSYPIDNCYAQFNIGTYHDPQETFPLFLDHNAGKNIVQPYLNSTAYAQSKNKPLLMFETNTASCGGFPGISDSFGAALWGTDYALQMAHSNFSGALMHIGGQNVFYNVSSTVFSTQRY